MPEFVLNRIYEIAREKSIDTDRIGLYGLTYKENVDDCRESPTLQLLENQKRHLAKPLKVYDPFIENDIVDNQYHSLNDFLNDIDLLVIMVKHNQIKESFELIKGKTILDCQNLFNGEDIYHI